MRELMGKDENKRQTFRYRETRDKEKENRMNNIVWLQCMDCSARRGWPFGKCEQCRYNIMRLTDDISKAEEIYLSQMAAKDAGDKAHKELMDEQSMDNLVILIACTIPLLIVYGLPLIWLIITKIFGIK